MANKSTEVACPICNKIMTKYKILMHMSKYHNILKDEYEEKYLHLNFKCDICGKRFEKEKQLDRHTKIKHLIAEREVRRTDDENKRIFVCEIDGEKFKDLRALSSHLTRNGYDHEEYWKKYLNHENKTGNCKQCGKSVPFRGIGKNYAEFCSFSCSTTWFAKNTDRIDRAMETMQRKKGEDSNYALNPSQLEYWLNKGYSHEDAKKKQTERQTTFSKEICIEKHGCEKGINIWKNRQKKWLKSYGRIYYSQISQQLFFSIKTSLDVMLDDKHITYYFAEWNGKQKTNVTNNEYTLETNTGVYKLDFYIPEINYILEFDGDYWHGEARGNQQRDANREQSILEYNPDFLIRHILERDYKNNPEEVVFEICNEIQELVVELYM